MKKFLRNQEHLETSDIAPITVYCGNLIAFSIQCSDVSLGTGILSPIFTQAGRMEETLLRSQAWANWGYTNWRITLLLPQWLVQKQTYDFIGAKAMQEDSSVQLWGKRQVIYFYQTWTQEEGIPRAVKGYWVEPESTVDKGRLNEAGEGDKGTPNDRVSTPIFQAPGAREPPPSVFTLFFQDPAQWFSFRTWMSTILSMNWYPLQHLCL